MKEILTYALIALAALFMSGYSIHMIVGGLVSENTEKIIIVAATLAGCAALAFIYRDIKKRKGGQS